MREKLYSGKIILQKVNGETRVLLFKAEKKATPKPQPKPTTEKPKPQIRYILQKVNGVTRLFMVKGGLPIGTRHRWKNGVVYEKQPDGTWKPVSKNGQFTKKPVTKPSNTLEILNMSGETNNFIPPTKIDRSKDNYSRHGLTEAIKTEAKYLWEKTEESKTRENIKGDEYMTILGTDNKILGTWKGTEGHIVLTNEILRLINSKVDTLVILIHSHLNGCTFSIEDIEFLCRHLSVKELFVIKNRWRMDSMAIPQGAIRPKTEKDKNGSSELRKSYEEIYKGPYSGLEKNAKKYQNENELRKAIDQMYCDVCEGLAKEYHWIFKRNIQIV